MLPSIIVTETRSAPPTAAEMILPGVRTLGSKQGELRVLTSSGEAGSASTGDPCLTVRPSPPAYWKQIRRNLGGAAAAVGGLWAASVVLRVLAHSSALLAVAGALSAGLVLVALLPYGALFHRSITVRNGRVLFCGLLKHRSIALEEVGSLVASLAGPDPQLLVLNVDGNFVWRVHLAYWPPDLEARLRAVGPTGRLRSFSPTLHR
jgi:hypothetical protein